MLFRAPVLCMAASLLCAPLAAALPTTERARSDMTLTSRDDTQCDANTNFYVCHLNNFRGCCSVDPCALKDGCPDKKEDQKDSNDTSKPSPNEDTQPAASCPPSGKKTKLFQPHTETLLPGASPITTPNLNVSKSGSTDQQQCISWRLPSTAKECSIGWSIPEERNFKAGDNALVAVYDAADDKTNNKTLGSANFAFWPDTPGARTNPVATVECKEDLTFRLQMVHDDMVFLEQNEETGWWVEYSC